MLSYFSVDVINNFLDNLIHRYVFVLCISIACRINRSSSWSTKIPVKRTGTHPRTRWCTHVIERQRTRLYPSSKGSWGGSSTWSRSRGTVCAGDAKIPTSTRDEKRYTGTRGKCGGFMAMLSEISCKSVPPCFFLSNGEFPNEFWSFLLHKSRFLIFPKPAMDIRRECYL